MRLKNVHIGDIVILTTDFGQRRKVVVIDRETKTQLIIGTLRFRRQTGYSVGSGAGGFNTTSIRVPRAGEIAAVREECAVTLLRRLVRQDTEVYLKKLSSAALKRIHILWETEYANLKDS